MRRFKYILIGLLLAIGIPVLASQISVPSAPSKGFFLVSTTTGAYIATTTDPIHAGSFFATSSIASWLPFASTTAITSSLASTTNLVVSSAGGSGTRCVQAGADGTISATAGACGVAGAGIQNLGPTAQLQSGTTITIATSSATSISGLTVGLTIVGNLNTLTFTPNFTGALSGLTTGNFSSTNISQWTNNSGYLTSLAGAASSTLLGDANTFSGVDKFTNASSDFGGTWQTFSPAHFLTGNQSITLSGAVTGSGATAITTSFGNAGANTVLANNTSGSAAPTFVATSTFFGQPTAGSVLAFLGGQWIGTATTTFSTGLSYLNGVVTNTGILSNAGDWAGTWQTFSPSHFQTALGFTAVPTTRNINTTYPVQGGGDLSADRTVTLAFGTTTANNWSALQNFNGNASTTGFTNSGITWLGITGSTQCLQVDTNGKVSGTGSVCGSAGGTVTAVTATFPNQSTGGATPVISSLFSTTSNSGMPQGFQYVGTGGIFQTGASSTFFGYIPLNPTRQLTFNGTAQQITSSAGAQDLTADRTWTFSLPSHVKFPIDFEASAGSTTNATSTYLSVTGSSTLATVNGAGLASCTGGTNALTWTGGTFGCQSITASGGAYPFTPSTDGGINTSATSTPIEGNNPGLGLDVAATSWYGIGGRLFGYASSTNRDTIIGLSAGGNNATTSSSIARLTALGYLALGANTTGANNTAVGEEALSKVTTNSQNTALGGSAATNTTGKNNIAIGYASLFNLTTGSGNIAIGEQVDVPSPTTDAQLNIANTIYGTGIYNGNIITSAPVLNASVGIGSTSPFAKFSIHTNNGDASQVLFAIGSSTQTATTTLIAADNTGALSLFGSVGSWIEKNINGNLFFASSTSLFNGTSTLADPNTGFIEFPQNGGCVGCTDLSLPGGINLRNAKFVNATTSNPAANVMQDVYTAPAGRRAYVENMYVSNGASVNVQAFLKTGGNYYSVTGTSSVGATVSAGSITGPDIVLEPGDSISVLYSVQSVLVTSWLHIIEFDSNTPFFSAKLLNPTAATTTLYTAPNGVTSEIMANNPQVSNGAGVVFYSNFTGNTIIGKDFLVKTGNVASDTMNLIKPQTTLVGANTVTATVVETAQPVGGLLMNSGDSFVIYPNNAGSIFWANIFEH